MFAPPPGPPKPASRPAPPPLVSVLDEPDDPTRLMDGDLPRSVLPSKQSFSTLRRRSCRVFGPAACCGRLVEPHRVHAEAFGQPGAAPSCRHLARRSRVRARDRAQGTNGSGVVREFAGRQGCDSDSNRAARAGVDFVGIGRGNRSVEPPSRAAADLGNTGHANPGSSARRVATPDFPLPPDHPPATSEKASSRRCAIPASELRRQQQSQENIASVAHQTPWTAISANWSIM